jgi:replicative DNA helicase
MRHPEKFDLYGQVIRNEYFTGLNAALAARCIIECLEKHGVSPTPTVLGDLMLQEFSKLGNEEQVSDAIAYIHKLSEISTRNADEVKDRLIAFCRERAIIHACSKVVEAVKTNTGDKINPIELVEEALMVGYDLKDDGVHLNQQYKEVIERVTSSTYGIRTGYPIFDDIWKTGWGPGWLVTIIAPPKRFKTAFCLNLALNMAGPQIGEDVFYYACEIGEDLAAWRMLCRMSGTPDEEAKMHPVQFVHDSYRSILEGLNADVYIKGFSSKMATIQDIRLHAKHMINRNGRKPKAIFIDHAECVRPSSSLSKNTPDFRQQSDIYTEARALGAELECTVIMPDRCNKETVDRTVPDMKSFQGAFEKAGIVDVAIGLCATPEEHLNHKIRAFVFLNRHGAAFHHISGTVDPERMNLEFTEWLKYDPEADDLYHRRRIGHRVNMDNIDNIDTRLNERKGD